MIAKHEPLNSGASAGCQSIISVEKNNRRIDLTQQINDSTLECMICCEKIKHDDPIYFCDTCYNIFHLSSCITKWSAEKLTTDRKWRCPACNKLKHFIPKKYFCFCGKIEDPYNYLTYVDHSCGQKCGKRCDRGKHKCSLPCHPGPCDPCQNKMRRQCYCLKTSSLMLCREETKLCDNICDRLLACLKHKCSKKCHKGDCEECKNICRKWLECFFHVCNRICHHGPCGPCGPCNEHFSRHNQIQDNQITKGLLFLLILIAFYYVSQLNNRTV